MAQLRNFQLFRNENAFTHASHEVAIAAFKQSSAWANMQDGEILLYSYIITGEENSPVHSLIGVVRNGKLDIITNEGTLREVVKNSIDALDSKVSTWEYDANGGRIANTKSVNVEIIQTDGKLTGLTVDYSNLTNVLDSLDYTHASIVELAQAEDKKSFKIYATNQENGQISEVVDGTIYFTDGVTSDNPGATQKYVDDSINALDGTATIATINDNNVVTLKAGIVEANGIVSNNTNNDIVLAKVAKTGAAVDVSVATITGMDATNVQDALAELQGDIDTINSQTITAEENQAVKVTTDAEGNTTIGLQLVEGEKVLSQTTDGLKSTLKVDIKTYTQEENAEQAGKTYIRLLGNDNVIVSEIDAANFVKDSFLKTVVIDEDNQELVFTWETINGDGTTSNTTTRISISALCDVYTAKENDWVVLNGFEFSHKIQEGIVIPENASTVTTATATPSVATAAGIATITVPELTIDKAGHITKQENKSYTIDLPVTAVAAGTGIAIESTTVAEGGNDTTYTVGLAEVNPVETPSTDDYKTNATSHTRVESITVDEFGRVTGYTLTKVQENFDMGMYN